MSVMLEKNDKINVVVPSSSLWLREDVSRGRRTDKIFVVLLQHSSGGENMSVMVEERIRYFWLLLHHASGCQNMSVNVEEMIRNLWY